jgi:hypothetical protein
MSCGFWDENFSLEKGQFEREVGALEETLDELEADETWGWRLLYLHHKARGSHLQ